MSLSGTLSSALSGLNVSSRAAELVATNIANATTPGYARRDLLVGARSLGGTGLGAQVNGVLRVTDRVLLSDRRIAQAAAAGHDARAAFLAAIETVIGTPQDATSLGGRIGALDAALLAAASHPNSEARLGEVLASARGLAAHLGQAATAVQEQRLRADAGIAQDVATLNDTLAKIAAMNGQIRSHVGAGRDASALMDQRQALVDQLSAIVPLREVARDDGQIALVTTGGAMLLDGRPAVFGFAPAGVVTADMTLASGALSGLTLNGRPLAMTDDAGMLAGGTLAAGFSVRDDLAPAAQAQLDALARDLMGRFSDPAVDSTLVPGAPGLFTDGGAAFDPSLETGLAQRLAINARADPSQGGALWRLRDGLGATAPGPPAISSLLTALQGALTTAITPASGGFMAGARSFATLASDMLSGIATARLSAEGEASFSTAKAELLQVLELEMGVDTDQQMQQLLVIEQAYAANAKVVKTVDEMIQMLLGI